MLADGETLVVVTRSAHDLTTLDTAYDLLRGLVNEHQARRIRVLVRETPNYGEKVRELAAGYAARSAITLEVLLK
jgi:hypothetical protein